MILDILNFIKINIDLFDFGIQFTIAVFLVWYTVETYRIRKREKVELKGYFGCLKNEPLQLNQAKKQLTIKCKNFGKTPIFTSKYNHTFINRGSGKKFPKSFEHSKAEILMPNGTAQRTITFSGAEEEILKNIYEYSLHLEWNYENIYSEKEKYEIFIKFFNGTLYFEDEKITKIN